MFHSDIILKEWQLLDDLLENNSAPINLTGHSLTIAQIIYIARFDPILNPNSRNLSDRDFQLWRKSRYQFILSSIYARQFENSRKKAARR